MKQAILQIFTAVLVFGLFCGVAAAAPPTAAFTVSTESGQAPLTVTFQNTTIGNVTSLDWDFGDGSEHKTENNPEHTYSSEGNYTVTLTAYNGGESDNEQKIIRVTAASNLTAAFDADPTTGTIPLTVKFTDKSTGSPDSYSWDFGDGGKSNDQNPEHIYNSSNKFTVRLTITKGTESKSITHDITVNGEDDTGSRIWEKGMPETYTWDALSFSGFYYDLDKGVSSESMTIKGIDRTINEGDIEYSTNATLTDFDYSAWGKYNVIGFMAEKYFAGYVKDDVVKEDISPISNGILSKILIDNDDKKSVSSGEALALEEGYSMSIKEVDVNGNSVWIQLEKDGKVVDDGFVSSNDNYIYKTDLGKSSDVPIIIIHFGTVFAGAETSAVFVQGIFQISENYLEVSNDDNFGEMEVTSINSNEIKMKNADDIGLDEGETVDLMGKIKIQVADSGTLRFAPIVDTSESGTYELRGTVYDEDKSGDFPFTWDTKNFEGFYYNIDEGIGTESLTIDNMNGYTIPEGKLVYKSTPQPVEFEYGDWGNFTVLGFMGDKYFAGYEDKAVDGEVDEVSVLNNNILTKVLIDSDDKKSVSQGSDLALEEGYSMSIKEVDVNGNSVWIQLQKDGKVVDDGFVSSNKNYIYKTDIGKATDIPLIIIHFGTVFSGAETSAVFVQGIFQISDEYTEINNDDTFGEMEVSDVSSSSITMKNTDSIGLDKGEDTSIMSNISFKTADSGTVRFYPFVTVQGANASGGLSINIPDEVFAGSTFDIKVTADGNPVEGVLIKVNGNSTGNTSTDGIVQYTAENTGKIKLTAEKKGYSTVSKEINVSAPRDEMSLSVSPEKVYIGDNITFTVLKQIGGSPIEGANISIDGQSLGTTGSNGNISYKADKNGTVKVTASKEGFNDKSIEVKVRDLEALFTVTKLTVDPMEVSAGKKATISATVVNTGNAAGNYSASLSINGNVTDTKEISLDVGGNETVTFSHIEEKPGNYTATLGEQTVTYKVNEKSSILLYVLGAVILLLIGGAAYYFTKGGGNVEDLQNKVQELIGSIKLKK